MVSRRCKDFQRNRKPLQKEKVIKEVKQFNPRFEEEFAAGKNYDPDRWATLTLPFSGSI